MHVFSLTHVHSHPHQDYWQYQIYSSLKSYQTQTHKI
jgi:hypothetical protein